MTERTEFHRYRTDVLMAHGVEPEAKETPDVDERDTWNLWKCVCCGERKRIPPNQHVCEDCQTL